MTFGKCTSYTKSTAIPILRMKLNKNKIIIRQKLSTTKMLENKTKGTYTPSYAHYPHIFM